MLSIKTLLEPLLSDALRFTEMSKKARQRVPMELFLVCGF